MPSTVADHPALTGRRRAGDHPYLVRVTVEPWDPPHPRRPSLIPSVVALVLFAGAIVVTLTGIARGLAAPHVPGQPPCASADMAPLAALSGGVPVTVEPAERRGEPCRVLFQDEGEPYPAAIGRLTVSYQRSVFEARFAFASGDPDEEIELSGIGDEAWLVVVPKNCLTELKARDGNLVIRLTVTGLPGAAPKLCGAAPVVAPAYTETARGLFGRLS
jgi:hypothetical protein